MAGDSTPGGTMSFFIFLVFIALVVIAIQGHSLLSQLLDQVRRVEGRLQRNQAILESLASRIAGPGVPPAAPPEPAPVAPATAPPSPPPVPEPDIAAHETSMRPPLPPFVRQTPPPIEPAPPEPVSAAEEFADLAAARRADEEAPLAAEDAVAEGPTFAEPPPPPPPLPSTEENLADLEKRFGTQWVVWVGGIALALGGIFLVRYSIEQGYFGPAARVTIGAVLALALIGVGERTRRQELRSGMPGLASAHIPSILTAAGTTVAYATVYGAYALYGFMSAAAAFVLLGIVALATLAAALVHGPMLAGLGLIGAYVTPLLVSTHQPNYWALYVYLAVVTASAFALARARLWRWLAITAAIFGIFWMCAGIADPHASAIAAHAFFALTGFALCAVFIVSGLLLGPPHESDRPDGMSSGILAGYVLMASVMVLATWHDGVALAALFVLVAATAGVALRAEAAAYAVPIAAALATLVVIDWAWSLSFLTIDIPQAFPGGPPRLQVEAVGPHLAFGIACAVVLGAGGIFAQGRSGGPLVPIIWAGTAGIAPIATLIALYYRLDHFERSLPFATAALLMAAVYGYATVALDRRVPRPGVMVATAVFACSALASLALALTLALEKGWLTVALALMAPGIAAVAAKRPLPVLRWAIAVIAGILMARIFWDPRIVGPDVGTTPILNWLLYGYGIPAVAFWVAGHILRQQADDIPSRMTDSAAILFTVLLSAFEIRHLVYDGDIFHEGSGLAEIALNISTALATTIGLERTRLRTGSIVHDWGARILGTLAFAGIVIGLGLAFNPMRTGDPVGGLLFNLIALGYGIPAVLVGVLARIVKTTRPREVYAVAAVTAIVLALAYLSLEVRTAFHGPVLTIGRTTDAEQYTYSAVWLAFGVALLLAGIMLRSQPARLASAAVVTLTSAKVFLYDLAGVQGVFRAFSFIGLGIVLMGIGYLYQRLLFPPRPRPAVEPSG
jgi:uncharacterized membrane protein